MVGEVVSEHAKTPAAAVNPRRMLIELLVKAWRNMDGLEWKFHAGEIFDEAGLRLCDGVLLSRLMDHFAGARANALATTSHFPLMRAQVSISMPVALLLNPCD